MPAITLEMALDDPAPLSFGPVPCVSITCRVCERLAEQPVSASGLLCSACRADLGATKRRIEQALTEAKQALVAAVDRWDTAYAQANALDQARFERVRIASGVWSVATFEQRYREALAQNDGLSALLLAKQACDTAADDMQRVQAWASAAQAEVEAASDALGVAIAAATKVEVEHAV